MSAGHRIIPRCKYCRGSLASGERAYNEHMATCDQAPEHVRTAALNRIRNR